MGMGLDGVPTALQVAVLLFLALAALIAVVVARAIAAAKKPAQRREMVERVDETLADALVYGDIPGPWVRGVQAPREGVDGEE